MRFLTDPLAPKWLAAVPALFVLGAVIEAVLL